MVLPSKPKAFQIIVNDKSHFGTFNVPILRTCSENTIYYIYLQGFF